MTQKADGMHYAPRGQVEPVCGPGEFRFAAVGLDHGHIYGMCNGLIEAGGELVWVYDPDPSKMEAFCRTYPGVAQARAEAEVLEDPSLALIASAPVPCQRGPLGLRTLDHGKDYFTDKPPFTTLEQLELAQKAGDGNFYEQSQVDSRLREMKMRLVEEAKQAKEAKK